MVHVIYDNFYLSNEIEDQFDSYLDLLQFCTVDNSLVGTAGMLRKINVYSATDASEKLAMGQGNSGSVNVTYKTKEYRIQLLQDRFTYFDEQAMTDDKLIEVGTKRISSGMFNETNKDIYSEFNNATMVVPVSSFDFDAFVDAGAMIDNEDLEKVYKFAFIHPSDKAEIRKKLKDDLKYIEAFVKKGYVGTVGDCNIYTKKNATPGIVIYATKKAVTYFNKKGTEVEQDRTINTRENEIIARKYFVVAFTDETQAVKMIKGTASLSTDTSVNSSKTYYEALDTGYVAVTPKSGDKPNDKGWYEIA